MRGARHASTTPGHHRDARQRPHVFAREHRRHPGHALAALFRGQREIVVAFVASSEPRRPSAIASGASPTKNAAVRRAINPRDTTSRASRLIAIAHSFTEATAATPDQRLVRKCDPGGEGHDHHPRVDRSRPTPPGSPAAQQRQHGTKACPSGRRGRPRSATPATSSPRATRSPPRPSPLASPRPRSPPSPARSRTRLPRPPRTPSRSPPSLASRGGPAFPTGSQAKNRAAPRRIERTPRPRPAEANGAHDRLVVRAASGPFSPCAIARQAGSTTHASVRTGAPRPRIRPRIAVVSSAHRAARRVGARLPLLLPSDATP